MADSAAEFPPGYAEANRSHWVLIPVLVLMPLTLIAFSIRTWARHVINGLGSEDWVLVAAMVGLDLPLRLLSFLPVWC